jgi:hypothetical protein
MKISDPDIFEYLIQNFPTENKGLNVFQNQRIQ